MKTTVKVLAVIIAVMMLSVTGSALSTGVYSFSFPDYTGAVGSMRWTYSALTSTGNAAYVDQDYASISTNYFLTTSWMGTTQATDVKSISTAYKTNLTWKPGYGGADQNYYLAGYPDPTVYHWPEYDVSGGWGYN